MTREERESEAEREREGERGKTVELRQVIKSRNKCKKVALAYKIVYVNKLHVLYSKTVYTDRHESRLERWSYQYSVPIGHLRRIKTGELRITAQPNNSNSKLLLQVTFGDIRL